jgi:predicted PurR-regulated permease PerM
VRSKVTALVTPPPLPSLRTSQVTLKTAFTVCFAVVATAALVLFVLQTRLALTLTVVAMMVAVALDHVVTRLQKRGLSRATGIAVTVLVVFLVVIGVLLIVVPTAVRQLRDFINSIPDIVNDVRRSHWFEVLKTRWDLEERLKDAFAGALGLAQSAANPILSAVTSALGAVAGFISILTLAVFMLVFGGGLVQRLLGLVSAANRPRWERVVAKSYGAIGGYLGGVLMICSVNATLTTTYLALSRFPYFLPLGLLSGLSSMVPYAGPILVGGFITLIGLLTGGVLKGLITVGYFLLYGQLEGNVLGPFVYKRTVQLDPLMTFLAVLFLADLLGIVGAVVAVPVVALAQILARELLALRRERLAAETPASQDSSSRVR